MPVQMQKIYNWYSRESVQKALLEVAKNREVVSVFGNGQFGKRPNVIQYPQDIIQAISEGAVAFHGSVERWSNPMQLDVGMSKEQLDNLRIGWDVLIDLDVDSFEIAKIATKVFIEALKDHGIKSFSLKFTGGTSFHIFLQFEALPEKVNMVPTKNQYPEMLQKIIEYLKWYTKEEMKSEILSFFDVREVSQRVGKPLNEIVINGELDPFKVISVDIFGSRHLFRLPYSLHESSLLVSLPLEPKEIDKFEKEQALPEKVKVEKSFLKNISFPEAEALVIEALDWAAKQPQPKVEIKKKVRIKPTKPIPEEFFPPCIKLILNGLNDGRKRSIFTLVNFLRNMNWDLEKIEKRIFEWNEKNSPQLRASYLRTQLRWHFRQERNLLPANCDNALFYDSIGICKPDEICENKKIKNPINYPFKKLKLKRGKRA
jgi:hypothetical protein